jgi:hypothetical protein
MEVPSRNICITVVFFFCFPTNTLTAEIQKNKEKSLYFIPVQYYRYQKQRKIRNIYTTWMQLKCSGLPTCQSVIGYHKAHYHM